MRHPRFRALSFSIALCLATITTAQAAISVAPTIQTLAPSQKSGQVVVTNKSLTESTIQVFVDKWSVADGNQPTLTPEEASKRCKIAAIASQNRYPSTDIRLAPSVMKLKPGASQIVRYVFTAPDGAPEHAYRVCVKEIPGPDAKPNAQGIIMASAMDGPWFWRSPEAKPQLSAQWSNGNLVVKNAGTATAQFVNLVAGSVSKKGLVGYVLPGETHVFALGESTRPSKVTATVNGAEQTLDVQ